MNDELFSPKDLDLSAAETEVVEIDGLPKPVEIRPLSAAEWSEVEATYTGGLAVEMVAQSGLVEGETTTEAAGRMSRSMRLDLSKAEVARTKSARVAAAYGMSVKGRTKWKPDQVGQLPPGVPERIAAEVYRLSGVDAPGGSQQAARFLGGGRVRGESGGADAPDAPHEWDSAGGPGG